MLLVYPLNLESLIIGAILIQRHLSIVLDESHLHGSLLCGASHAGENRKDFYKSNSCRIDIKPRLQPHF